MLSSIVARRSSVCCRRVALVNLKRQQQAPARRFTATMPLSHSSKPNTVWQKLRNRPIEYATIPCVAAFVGIMTNWMGVKMLFYPIEYFGTEWYRAELSPYGYFGWQGT
jgi:hypothetical protein